MTWAWPWQRHRSVVTSMLRDVECERADRQRAEARNAEERVEADAAVQRCQRAESAAAAEREAVASNHFTELIMSTMRGVS